MRKTVGRLEIFPTEEKNPDRQKDRGTRRKVGLRTFVLREGRQRMAGRGRFGKYGDLKRKEKIRENQLQRGAGMRELYPVDRVRKQDRPKSGGIVKQDFYGTSGRPRKEETYQPGDPSNGD